VRKKELARLSRLPCDEFLALPEAVQGAVWLYLYRGFARRQRWNDLLSRLGLRAMLRGSPDDLAARPKLRIVG
jgi:hypothetical protein